MNSQPLTNDKKQLRSEIKVLGQAMTTIKEVIAKCKPIAEKYIQQEVTTIAGLRVLQDNLTGELSKICLDDYMEE